MITKQQALTASEFHYGQCTEHIGPRGGKTINVERWRRNGATQTWKTRPDHFRVPIKYGMYTTSQLWHYDAKHWHTAEDCPLRNAGAENPTSAEFHQPT